MTAVNLALDVFGLCILLLLHINVIAERDFAHNDTKAMLVMIPAAMIYIVTNIISILCAGKPQLNALVSITTVFSYMMGYAVATTFMELIIYYSENKLLIRIVPRIVLVLGIISFIPLSLSVFTHWFFYVENGICYPKPSYLAIYIFILVFYVSLTFICITQNKVTLTAKITSVLNILFYAIAIYGQQIHPNLKIIYPITTLVVLMAYMELYSKRSSTLKQTKQELNQAEISVMLSKIQPHFLFNSLTSISHLCASAPDQAQKAVDDFAKYLRMNMDSLGNNKIVDFATELKHTKIYLSLEKLRFEDRLNVDYNISCDCFKIPSLTLQPIVENAVRHGIIKKDEGGTIRISTHLTDSDFIVSIKDDGVGFNQATTKLKQSIPNTGRSHIGLENVEQRLETMCHGRMEIYSAKDTGTTITLYIPIENQLS